MNIQIMFLCVPFSLSSLYFHFWCCSGVVCIMAKFYNGFHQLMSQFLFTWWLRNMVVSNWIIFHDWQPLACMFFSYLLSNWTIMWDDNIFVPSSLKVFELCFHPWLASLKIFHEFFLIPYVLTFWEFTSLVFWFQAFDYPILEWWIIKWHF